MGDSHHSRKIPLKGFGEVVQEGRKCVIGWLRHRLSSNSRLPTALASHYTRGWHGLCRGVRGCVVLCLNKIALHFYLGLCWLTKKLCPSVHICIWLFGAFLGGVGSLKFNKYIYQMKKRNFTQKIILKMETFSLGVLIPPPRATFSKKTHPPSTHV